MKMSQDLEILPQAGGVMDSHTSHHQCLADPDLFSGHLGEE